MPRPKSLDPMSEQVMVRMTVGMRRRLEAIARRRSRTPSDLLRQAVVDCLFVPENVSDAQYGDDAHGTEG